MTADVRSAIDDAFAAVRALGTALHCCGGNGEGEGAVDAAVVREVRRLLDHTELAVTWVVDRFVATTSFRELGYPNAGLWMADNTAAWRSEPSARQAHADVLRELPSFAASLQADRIGYAHVRLLAKAVTNERLALAHRDEAVLLRAAELLDPSRFAKALQRWTSYCDDALSDPSASDRIHERRKVRLHQRGDGSWLLEGLLDETTGEALDALFDAFLPKPSPDDSRTMGQKRHDTLADVINEALARTDRPLVGGELPHLTLHVDAESGNATFGSGAPVPGFVRDMFCCDCKITPVWFTRSGMPFDIGTPTSEIPLRNRRAVIARDRCCRVGGCHRPARFTELHHIRYRDDGGTHEVENVVMVCRFHHRMIHRWSLEVGFEADGTFVVTLRDGTQLRSPPGMPLAA